MITVRPLRPPECAPAARVVSELPLWRTRYSYPADRAERDLQLALDRGDLVLGAFEEAGPDGANARPPAPLGVAWLMPRGCFGRAPYLKLIAVAAAAQGRGVGRLLLDAAAAHFTGHAHQLYLLVSDFNVDAQRFYRREGFQQVGALPDFVLPGVAELLFVKRLG